MLPKHASIAPVSEVQEYLSAAVDYINTGAEGISVEDIKGIWLASDDPAAVDEVRAAVPAYLPNVANSTVVWVSSGVPGGPRVREMTTRSDRQVWTALLSLCQHVSWRHRVPPPYEVCFP